jgi:hypothetical protein
MLVQEEISWNLCNACGSLMADLIAYIPHRAYSASYPASILHVFLMSPLWPASATASPLLETGDGAVHYDPWGSWH